MLLRDLTETGKDTKEYQLLQGRFFRAFVFQQYWNLC